MYLVNNFFEGINRIEMPKSLKEDKDVVALTITEQNKLEEFGKQIDSFTKTLIENQEKLVDLQTKLVKLYEKKYEGGLCPIQQGLVFLCISQQH